MPPMSTKFNIFSQTVNRSLMPPCGAEDNTLKVDGNRSRMARNIPSCVSMRCSNLFKHWFSKYRSSHSSCLISTISNREKLIVCTTYGDGFFLPTLRNCRFLHIQRFFLHPLCLSHLRSANSWHMRVALVPLDLAKICMLLDRSIY